MQEYTVPEMARLVGVAPQTIRNWSNAGLINVHRYSPGGVRYYTDKEVQQAKQLTHAEVKGLCKKLA